MNIQIVQTGRISLLLYYFQFCENTEDMLQDVSASTAFILSLRHLFPVIFSESALQTVLHELDTAETHRV